MLLWIADGILSKERTLGWERNGVFDAEKRWTRGRGRHAVLLGSSTSVDWLRPRYVEGLFELPRGSVVDAHINGCHQGCTFAEVRRLIKLRKRYRMAFYGTNQFQLCEHVHSKRVLQQSMMIPPRDVPDLFGLYLHAEQPLNYVARFLGMAVSGTYGDTLNLQRTWSRELFGRPARGRQHLWYTTAMPPRPPWLWCDYEPDRVAYKAALSRALYQDLRHLADRVFLMLLPDENLSSLTPEMAEAWRAHRRLHRQIADELPHVVLLDLSGPRGAWLPRHFKDGFHVSAEGAHLQRQLFERLLRRGGHIAARQPPAGASKGPPVPKVKQPPAKAAADPEQASPR